MNYREALESELKTLPTTPKGTTLKYIHGTYYLYHDSKCMGTANQNQIHAFKTRKLVIWLLKNESKFLEGLTLLKKLKLKEKNTQIK